MDNQYENAKKKINEKYSKMLNNLYSRYSHESGMLDGGPPKKEEQKITNEWLQQLKKYESFQK